MNFNVKPDIPSAHTTHMICCLEDKEITTDKLQLHFLELKKSINTLTEKDLTLWYKFFGSPNFEEEKAMLANENIELKQAIGDYELFRSDKDYMSEYEKRQTFLLGQSMMMNYEFEKGKEEGITIGEQRGVLATARAMKQGGLSIQDISRFTGLSEEQIEKL